MRNLLALTFAAILALAACANDDATDEATEAAAAGDDAGSDDAASDDGASDDGAADDGGSDDGASDDGGSDDGASGEGADGDAGSDDGAPVDDGADDAAASGDNETFCTAMAELDEALDLEPPLLDPSRSPDEVEELVVDVETKFQAVVDNSPPEYEADWLIVTDAFREMTGLIRDAEFEVEAVDQAAVLEAGSNEEAFAAGDRLPSEQEFCGS